MSRPILLRRLDGVAEIQGDQPVKMMEVRTKIPSPTSAAALKMSFW